jgi:hypothetical protein
MACMKPVLTFVIVTLSWMLANAWAQAPAAPVADRTAPQAQTKAPHAAPDGKSAAPLKKPIRRRSVEQVISSMPPAPPIVTDGYRPGLQPRTPSLATPSPTAVLPPSPAQINSCDAGGCTDTNGTRYNGGVGNSATTGQGRSCLRSGTTMQCF